MGRRDGYINYRSFVDHLTKAGGAGAPNQHRCATTPAAALARWGGALRGHGPLLVRLLVLLELAQLGLAQTARPGQ